MAKRASRVSTSDRRDILLTEYRICQDSANRLEAIVWQTSSIMGVGSVATLALVATRSAGLVSLIIVAMLASVIPFLWWQVARRLWSIEHLKLARMLEIEQELDLVRQTRQLKYLDDLHKRFGRKLKTDSKDPTIAEFRSELRRKYRISVAEAADLEQLDHHRRGPQDVLKWFPVLNGLLWGLFTYVELIRAIYEAFR